MPIQGERPGPGLRCSVCGTISDGDQSPWFDGICGGCYPPYRAGIEAAARIVCIACRKGDERRSGWHPYMSPPGKCIAARIWRALEAPER